MTIIAAVKTDNMVIVGADKRVTSDNMILDENSSKILIKKFRIAHYRNPDIKSEFLIAFSGVYSLFELLKVFKAPPMRSRDTFFEYLYKTLIPSLNSYLKDYNFIQDCNGVDGVDWELLIVYQDKMYTIEFNLGIIEVTSEYFAIGGARDIAYGSLHTSQSLDNPKLRVLNAIHACAAHSINCNNKCDLYQSKINENGEYEIKQLD